MMRWKRQSGRWGLPEGREGCCDLGHQPSIRVLAIFVVDDGLHQAGKQGGRRRAEDCIRRHAKGLRNSINVASGIVLGRGGPIG